MPPWTNRIVGHRAVAPDQLLANPKNWRIHPLSQRAALKGLITDIGYTDAVEVQAGTDMVLDGHLRVALALQEDQPVIWVTDLDLSDAEADEYLVAKDPVAAMAGSDADQLRDLLDAVHTEDEALAQMLAGLAATSGVLPPVRTNPHDEWVGMPEFGGEDRRPQAELQVYFASEADKVAFGLLIGQDLSVRTRWVWHPPQEPPPSARWVE